MPARSLVIDANVWIDLAAGRIVEQVFHLGYLIASPDLIVGELRSPAEAELVLLGLDVVGLTPDQVQAVVRLAEDNRQISPKDLAAFFVARDRDAVLVTGDARLRGLAVERGMQVRGVLWILDEATYSGNLSPPDAAEALKTILARGGRLPRRECEERLRKWRGA